MKNKYLFDLQLFAEETGEEGGEGSQTEEKGKEGKEGSGQDGVQAKYTDDDVDKILERKFAEWQKKQEKKISEAERLGKMSEAEKANERIKQLEERLAAADKEKAVTAMSKQARAILADKNINVGDELIANLIAEDAETTKASVESFATMFQNAVDKAVKEALKGEPPKKGGTSGMTKDQILAVANRAERQKLIKENMHLFN